jgi:hypothetical protein
MLGGCEKRSEAFSMSAASPRPVRCAYLPFSFWKCIENAEGARAKTDPKPNRRLRIRYYKDGMAPWKLKDRLGTCVTSSIAGETVRAFIPPPLPPFPELQLNGLHQHLDRANPGPGRLNGMKRLLPASDSYFI